MVVYCFLTQNIICHYNIATPIALGSLYHKSMQVNFCRNDSSKAVHAWVTEL